MRNIWYSEHCEYLKLQHKQGRDVSIVFFIFPKGENTMRNKNLSKEIAKLFSLLVTFFIRGISISLLTSPEEK